MYIQPPLGPQYLAVFLFFSVIFFIIIIIYKLLSISYFKINDNIFKSRLLPYELVYLIDLIFNKLFKEELKYIKINNNQDITIGFIRKYFFLGYYILLNEGNEFSVIKNKKSCKPKTNVEVIVIDKNNANNTITKINSKMYYKLKTSK